MTDTTKQQLLADIQELAPAKTSCAKQIEARRTVPDDLIQWLRAMGISRVFCTQESRRIRA